MASKNKPDYHFIKVRWTNGTEYITRSTLGKDGDLVQLIVDPSSHRAWKKGSHIETREGSISKFKKRYEGLLS